MLLPLWSVALATGIAAGISAGPGRFSSSCVARCCSPERRSPFLRRVVAGRGCAGPGAGRDPGRARGRSADPAAGAARASGRERAEVAVRARWVRTVRFERGAGAAGRAGGRRPGRPSTAPPPAGRLAVNLRPGQGGFLPGRSGPVPRPAGRDRPAWPIPGCPTRRLRAAGARGSTCSRRRPAASRSSLEQPGARLSPRRLAHRAHLALAAALDRRACAAGRGPPARAGAGRSVRRGAEVEAGFKAAGALHVLSVSGLHLTAIAAFLFLIVRRAPAGLSAPGAAGARRRWWPGLLACRRWASTRSSPARRWPRRGPP